VILGLLTFVSTAVAVAYPLVFRWVLDRLYEVLSETGALGKLSIVLLVLGLIALGRVIAGFYPATRALVNLRLDKQIREDVFGNLMGKDYRFNNTFRTGDVVTRLTDDIYEFPKISWFGCSGIFRAVESSSKLIFCLAVMVSLSWKLTLMSIVPLPIMMWFFYSLRHKIREYVQDSQRAISRTNDLLEAAFAGIRIVKAFRAERGQQARLAEIMKDRRRIFLGLMKLQTVLWSLDTLASRLGQMIVIAAGGIMVIRGELSVGTLFAFYVFLDMLSHPMMDLPHLFMTAQQAFVSIDRVDEIRTFPVTVVRSGGGRLRDIDAIAFEDVTFSYDGARNSIDEASFRVVAGQRVAVVGPVASGKSTLLKLLAGILEPTAGRILINGRPMSDWDWDVYRLRLGYVPQEGVLFSRSIRENVLFGRRAPTGDGAEQEAANEAWAQRWLSVAQMEGDLPDLPQGMDTVVGQKGSLVSGGQKQRIAIARALAGRPQVLLLDDCTAALDARNEDRFWASLTAELGDCTCFIVSHRLATIRQADHILVLEDGRLVDAGTHEDLALRCETYREFLSTERRKAHLEADTPAGRVPVATG
jgi:ATP-binding cassette subfamily B protein